MIIYRVEDRQGHGPYINTPLPEITLAHNNAAHPSPTDSGCVFSRYSLKDHHLFGFSTEEGLRKWFAGWEQRLEGAGFHISVIRTTLDRVLLGREQLVFDNRYAELEEVVPW